MAAIKIGDFVKITFSSQLDTSITQLETGTVCLLLYDTATYVGTYRVTDVTQIPDDLSVTNQDYIRLALRGGPREVIAVVLEGTASTVSVDTTKLGVLETLTFDYLAIPGITSTDTEDVAEWVAATNANPVHRFKAVLPNCAADDWHVINYAHESVIIDGTAYDTSKATAYVAGEIAATVPRESMTMHEAKVDSCSAMTIADIDAAGAAGKLVLFDDGNTVCFASDVNSLTTLDTGQDESYQDILCVESMDLFYNSAKVAILNKYIGKFKNSYQNKLMLSGEVYNLLKDFENNGLAERGDTDCIINVEKQKAYLRSINYKTKDGKSVDDMSTDEILRANTKKKVFLKVRMIPLSAIESVEIDVET